MKRIDDDTVVRAMVAATLVAATLAGVPTATMTPAQWTRTHQDTSWRYFDEACVFTPWANRVSLERLTVRRVAHALHAAHTVYCMREFGFTRRQCRPWRVEPREQQFAYLDAARRIRRQLLRAEEGGVRR